MDIPSSPFAAQSQTQLKTQFRNTINRQCLRPQNTVRPSKTQLTARKKLYPNRLEYSMASASSALIQQAFQFSTTKGTSSKNLAAAAKSLSILQQQELRNRGLLLD